MYPCEVDSVACVIQLAVRQKPNKVDICMKYADDPPIEVRAYPLGRPMLIQAVQQHDVALVAVDMDHVFFAPDVVRCVSHSHRLVSVKSILAKGNLGPVALVLVCVWITQQLQEPWEEVFLQFGKKVL